MLILHSDIAGVDPGSAASPNEYRIVREAAYELVRSGL